MARTTKTKTKTTRADSAALADMFAALSAAAHRGAVKDWHGCRVQLRAATVLAPDEKLREAIGTICEYLGDKK